MFKPELSVVTYTIREGGLEWMMRYLSQQTFKNFEWIVVDAFYEERKDLLKNLSIELGVHLVHLPEPKIAYKIWGYNLASNGNEAFKHVTTPYIVIIDDWHVFPQNLLENHLEYLKKGFAPIPQWVHTEKYLPSGEEYPDYKNFSMLLDHITRDEDSRMKDKNVIASLENDPAMVLCNWTWWWPNASGIGTKYAVTLCSGYDERLNGGTGGTDVDLSYRMGLVGAKFLYLPKIKVYHLETSGLRTREFPDCCTASVNHDRREFTNNQYHQGDPNLVENDYLKTFVEDSVKFYDCKICGAHGVIDSQEVLKSNMARNKPIPPWYAAGKKRTTLFADREILMSSGYSHSTKCSICKGE